MADKRNIRSKDARRPARRTAAATDPRHALQTVDFRRKNWILFGSGIGSIVVGFLLLALGDITLAPILLVGGYLVLVPWALVARGRSEEASPGVAGEAGEKTTMRP